MDNKIMYLHSHYSQNEKEKKSKKEKAALNAIILTQFLYDVLNSSTA